MNTITYSLKLNEKDSQEYYRTVRQFTDHVTAYSADTLLPLVNEYRTYLSQYNLEAVREPEEYLLELLSFGILWKIYAPYALSIRTAPFITMAHMAEWRKKHQAMKPYIDIFRGVMTTMFLMPENRMPLLNERPTLLQIDQVCKWFEATGEFREQSLRFIRWRAYWQSIGQEELASSFKKIHEFTEWFETESEAVLGRYTSEVEKFLNNSEPLYRWREDRISCTRRRIEYHLNMVGAELMNRAFRKEFKNTDEKVVLLPGCMRAKSAEECKARRVPEGLICTGCSKECNVNRLRLMGKEKNFGVYIIPHASDLSLWSPRPGKPKKGIIASACVTTLVEGGWELKRYDVNAQCVLLDFCGCKKHWMGEGLITELNTAELERILD